jgi:beta-lactamase class C
MNRGALFTATIISLWCSTFAGIQTSIPPKLRSFITKLETKKEVVQGGAVAILYQGNVVYKETFGNQKAETNPITSSTLFPLASVSKAVTSTAIALMVQQGRLSLNEKFKLPYLKNPVSLINILGHTTGYQFSGNKQIEQGVSRQKLLCTLQNQKPKSKPGRCYSYSNTTFSLVEEVLNKKGLSLREAIDNLRVTLKTNEIQIVPIDPKMEVAYPHSKKTFNGDDVVTQLPFPPYYPKTTPASAGIFASIDGMIEIFRLNF